MTLNASVAWFSCVRAFTRSCFEASWRAHHAVVSVLSPFAGQQQDERCLKGKSVVAVAESGASQMQVMLTVDSPGQ
eukprot:2461866-Rhodomonas_salina.1